MDAVCELMQGRGCGYESCRNVNTCQYKESMHYQQRKLTKNNFIKALSLENLTVLWLLSAKLGVVNANELT